MMGNVWSTLSKSHLASGEFPASVDLGVERTIHRLLNPITNCAWLIVHINPTLLNSTKSVKLLIWVLLSIKKYRIYIIFVNIIHCWTLMEVFLSKGLSRRGLLPKVAARWRYRLPIKNVTAHYNSQFCDSINFVLFRKPENASKRVWIGPKCN